MSHALQRILVVDDDVDILLIARLSLESDGRLVVDTCSSGAETVARAESFRPDVILLDFKLNDMDGPQVLSALRSKPETAHIPVIFLTASIQPSRVEEYRRRGALAVIAKPFDPRGFAAEVSDIWEKGRGTNHAV
jgi:CheY-like chemotaxis protein